MDNNPIKTERRRARREQRLGIDATCIMCGESALEVLIQVPWRLIEQHHVMGKNHDPDVTVPVCQNCHTKLHEQMDQEGVDLRESSGFPERLLNMLRSLAAFFRMLGDTFSEWARQLAALMAKLDEGFPAWRAFV